VAVFIAGAVRRGGMSKESRMTDPANPWSVPVVVAQIPDSGLHREFAASANQLQALAALGGLREVASARASLDLTLMREGRVHVVGNVSARVGQICVVTLDPVENEIDETIDLIFAPEQQIPALADLVEDAAESDAEIPDPPEPIIGGIIDLGRLATDALLLGIDPYPRKPDAVFDLPVIPDDPEDHPFAALKALKREPDQADSKKPKDG
jgi:uncharacterized metal-binding protein YceD (DUF177 family)